MAVKKSLFFMILLLTFVARAHSGVPDRAALKTVDEKITLYQQQLKANPADLAATNGLAYAYNQKVRQTADYTYNTLAEKLLLKALEKNPNNYYTLLNLAMVRMAQHRFSEAREAAQKAIAADNYGFGAHGILGDANCELGLYAECAEAYDRMGDLMPGSGYDARVADYLRLTGDMNGAVEMMLQAWKDSSEPDAESRAWYLVQLGNYTFEMGKLDSAQDYYESALKLYPGSYNALAGLAKAKAGQGKTEEAIQLYQQAIAIVPMPDFVSNLGDLYASLGRKQEANQQYALVEYIALISQINKEMYNRQLALYYADHDKKLDEALLLAQKELASRKDIYGYDALGWCLYKNGKTSEAVDTITNALKMGTQDAKLFYHAGMIYAAAGRAAEAKDFLQKAMTINPYFQPLQAKTAAEKLSQIAELR